jgi:hypothetical protein
MTEYHSFPEEGVQEALSAAAQYKETYQSFSGTVNTIPQEDGEMSLLAGCITLTIGNGKVCLNLPLGLGKVCIPVPISYNGKVASACLKICTKWGIPTGVKITISVGGVIIVSKKIGKC